MENQDVVFYQGFSRFKQSQMYKKKSAVHCKFYSMMNLARVIFK